ncbi:MAG: hypothetical protein M0Z57_01725 [Deltaproteobacteria bacterium]|jgi:hypothetical protein|uniref:DUF1640 domain-containing protein n=1 Tax=Candidatus Acidulodesulfobacterium acidiphilum TaxID=2597224 RepID=A0A520XBA6_9DELT|nr:hypothetical protein [Deltaproteobacteria bacterium]MDA8298710.1 hypothetical protein [Deltaproteobacteria bacterium]RZV38405.1 MAG: hypothetical protein EVJ48_07085 [Candidatus Acidulodesulfobacterium acidiphilum]
MEEIKKSEDYMNMSMAISPEKYFDSRFDGQEKLFTEKFNTLQTQINSIQTQIETLSDRLGSEISRLDDKIDFEITSLKENEIKNLNDKMDAGFKAQSEKFETKIDALDKRLTFGFTVILSVLGVLTAVLGVLVTLHFIGR